ncbi:hypothetical protein TUA1478L_09570 [Lactiplantibacillus plantarum]
MYQVKTYNAIAPAGLNTFTADYTLNQSEHPDAYLIRSVNLHTETLPSSLKVIVRAGAGVNNIPIDQATANGTAVFNTREVTLMPLRNSSSACSLWHPVI